MKLYLSHQSQSETLDAENLRRVPGAERVRGMAFTTYTVGAMDKVRFGRALGYGARHAAKALKQAVDAATTPSASSSKTPSATSEQRQPADVRQTVAEAGRTVLQAHQTVQNTKAQLRGAAKMAGKSALAPVAKFSSVLWLEVTGTFFALVAAAMCEAVWKLRGAWAQPATSNDRIKLYFCATLAALFLYFTISNFVRAARRQRH
jgi:hypothetical protein